MSDETEKLQKELEELIQKTGKSAMAEIAQIGSAFGDMTKAAAKEIANLSSSAKQPVTEQLDTMLKEYQTYQQKMTDIAKKYEGDRNKVIAAGGSEENMGLTYEAEQAAVDALNLEYAKKESTFQVWMNQLALLSLNQLKRTLEEAQIALVEAETSGKTGQEVAEAQAKVNEAQKAVKEAETSNTGTDKRLEEWGKFETVLKKVSGQFGEIGDAIGGTAGASLKAVGTVATSTLSIIGGIQKFGDLSMKMTQLTAGTTSAAIVQVERASVILAIIGVVIQVIQTMTGLFKDNKQALKDAADATREYEEGIEDIARAKRYDLFDTVFGTDSLGKFQEARKIALETLQNIQDQVDGIKNRRNDSIWRKMIGGSPIDQIEATFDGRSMVNKIFGKGKNKVKTYVFDINDYINSDGTLKLEELQAWYDAYEKGLDEEEKRIIENLIDEGKTYAEATQVITDYIDGLWGDLASSIADNMIDAFLETGDAAANLGEVVRDVTKDMAKSMIESLLFNGDEAQKVKAIFDKDLGEQLKTMLFEGKQEEANALVQEAITRAEALAPVIEGIIAAFNLANDKARTASQKGFAAASQNTVDELNGRFTAMQQLLSETRDATFSISEATCCIKEGTAQLVGNTGSILNEVVLIRANTDNLGAMAENLSAMKADMGTLKTTVNNIELRGIALKTS